MLGTLTLVSTHISLFVLMGSELHKNVYVFTQLCTVRLFQPEASISNLIYVCIILAHMRKLRIHYSCIMPPPAGLRVLLSMGQVLASVGGGAFAAAVCRHFVISE